MRNRMKFAMIGAVGVLLATPVAAVPAAGVPARAGATQDLTPVQNRDRAERRDHRRRDGRWDDRRRGGFNLFIGPGGPGVTYGRGGRCALLRDRAASTGSGYWWRRYRNCRGY